MTDNQGDESSSQVSPDQSGSAQNSSGWRSMTGVLAVQTQNAFNDHLVKMIIIALARSVQIGWFGEDITSLLTTIILISFVIFSPITGFLADKYSKRSVIKSCLLAQVGIFGIIFLGVYLQSHWIILFGFILISVQSVFFSPAKFGIGKELVGSRGVGLAASLLQMLTMLGILGGMWISGPWYDGLIESGSTPWEAALQPILVIGLLCLIPLFLLLTVRPTAPAHPERPFTWPILWSQIGDLRALLGPRNLRLAGLGVAFFWGMSSFVSVVVVDIAYELYPPTAGEKFSAGGLSETSQMVASLSIGVVIGSVLASLANRRGIELGIVPIGGIGVVIGLAWTGLSTAGTSGMYMALGTIGMAGAMFMVPLNAYLQDKADPKRRGQIMAAVNVLDCLAGIVAVIIFQIMKGLGISPIHQFLYLAIPAGLIALYVFRILPGNFLTFIALTIFRRLYKIEPIHQDRIPETGGVLLVSNHMTFVDAFVMASACNRKVRFVIYDHYYNQWWAKPFLKILGAVPISKTRAKDAIRTTADAVSKGDVVCIFPEGQLSRHGMMNDMKKGFELIARKAGCPIMPAFMDSLWGSVFSYESDRVFKKRPLKIPYRVRVIFGHPLEAKETSAEKLRRTLSSLGEEAFHTRDEISGGLPRSMTYSLARHGRKIAVIDARIRSRSTRKRPILAVARRLAKVWQDDFDGRERVGVLLANSGAATMVHAGLVLAGKVPVNLPFNPGEDPNKLRKALEDAGIRSLITASALRESNKDYPWPKDTRGIADEIGKAKDGLFIESLKLAALPTKFLLPKRIQDPDKEAAAWISADGKGGFQLKSLTHKALVANVHQMANINMFRREDKVLTCTEPASFEGVVAGLWLPILHGITAVNLPIAAKAETIALLAQDAGATVAVADTSDRAMASAPALRATYFLTELGSNESLANESLAEKGVYPLAVLNSPPALVAANVAHPAIPEDGDIQHGWLAGSPGRIIPGIACRINQEGILEVSGAALGSEKWVPLPKEFEQDLEGFLTQKSSS